MDLGPHGALPSSAGFALLYCRFMFLTRYFLVERSVILWFTGLPARRVRALWLWVCSVPSQLGRL
jgi:hypothetical protein